MSFAQDDWVDWLPLAEFASNNQVSETTGTTPFFANYGFHPRMGTEPSDPCPPDLSATQKRQFYKANTVADRFERILSQLKALTQQSIERYEQNANEHREEAPRYQKGQLVYVNTRNMKTNRPMKKGDDKWAGPWPVEKVYRRACLVTVPEGMRIFPVFHTSLLRPKPSATGLPGQAEINESESRNIRGRVLERDDGTEELVERWEFEAVQDVHDEDGAAGLTYLVKWKHHPASWQPQKDLDGQEAVLYDFHKANADKPGPPAFVNTWARQQGKPTLPVRKTTPDQNPPRRGGLM
jgi:hypothetical protein